MKQALFLCLLVVLAGCVGPEGTPIEDLFTGEATILDLTHPVSAEAPYWPGPDVSPFRHDTLVANEDGSPRMGAYSVPERFGTHFDAPVHGGPGWPRWTGSRRRASSPRSSCSTCEMHRRATPTTR